jgi:hypothetical protein
MESRQECYICAKGGQLLFSNERKCYVHTHCLVERLTSGDLTALAIAKEFDMVSDASECSIGCDECVNRWCGR